VICPQNTQKDADPYPCVLRVLRVLRANVRRFSLLYEGLAFSRCSWSSPEFSVGVMSEGPPNKPAAGNSGFAPLFHIQYPWLGVPEPERSVCGLAPEFILCCLCGLCVMMSLGFSYKGREGHKGSEQRILSDRMFVAVGRGRALRSS